MNIIIAMSMIKFWSFLQWISPKTNKNETVSVYMAWSSTCVITLCCVMSRTGLPPGVNKLVCFDSFKGWRVDTALVVLLRFYWCCCYVMELFNMCSLSMEIVFLVKISWPISYIINFHKLIHSYIEIHDKIFNGQHSRIKFKN